MASRNPNSTPPSWQSCDELRQTLTGRIRQLAERYASPLPQLADEVEQLAAKVAAHLQKMGAY